MFRFGGEDDLKSKKKELYKNIKRDIDPKNLWEILSEIGDGAFGKVYKVRTRRWNDEKALTGVLPFPLEISYAAFALIAMKIGMSQEPASD